MTVAVFAGFSGSRKINISIAAINALAYAGAYLYVHPELFDIGRCGRPSYRPGPVWYGPVGYHTFLRTEYFIISYRLRGLSNKIFVRNVILLSFSLISVLFLIMADNTVLFMVSLIISILSIFNLLASLGGDRIPVREYTAKIWDEGRVFLLQWHCLGFLFLQEPAV